MAKNLKHFEKAWFPCGSSKLNAARFFAENLAFYEWKGDSASEVLDHKIVLERSGRARLDGQKWNFPSP
jgi:hypothetical protein